MTGEAATNKTENPKGTGAFRMALLLFVIALILGFTGATGASGLLMLCTLVCAIIGGVQRMSAPR